MGTLASKYPPNIGWHPAYNHANNLPGVSCSLKGFKCMHAASGDQTNDLCLPRADLSWPQPVGGLMQDFSSRPEVEVRPLQRECWVLATRPPGTRPWLVSCVEMNFHIETKSSETNNVFIRRKKSLSVDRHTGRLRESRTLVVIWITLKGYFFWVSLGQSPCFS